jgi:Carboxypeptidase regulatory-like domain
MRGTFKGVMVGMAMVAGVLSGGPARPASAAAAELRGTIRSNVSALVSNATVDVLVVGSNSVVASTSSNANGVYSLAVPEGTYDVRFTGPSGSGLGQATIASQLISPPSTLIDVVLTPIQAVVSGRVVDGSGVGLANVNVNLRPQSCCSTYSATTDSTGSYSLTVTAGVYSMRTDATAMATGRSDLPSSFSHERRPMTIAADTVLADVVYTFDTHEVTVLKADGSPATVDVVMNVYPDAMVFYMGNTTVNDVYGFNHRSAVSGTASFPIINSPSAQLTVYRPGEYYGQLLTANANTTTTNSTTMTLPANYVVSGRVVDSAGVGLANVSISLPPQSCCFPYSAMTDATGHYSVTVPAGVYAVRSNASAMGVSRPDAPHYFNHDRRPVAISADTVLADIVYTFDTHQITVLNADGSPAGVDVVLGGVADSMVFYMGNTTINDVYGFTDRRSVSGTTTLPIVDSRFTQLQVFRTGEFTGPLLTVTIDTATTNSTTVTLPAPPAQAVLTGRVVDAAGAGLANVNITLQPQSCCATYSAFTDATGGYSMTVPAGPYYIRSTLSAAGSNRTDLPTSANHERRPMTISGNTVLNDIVYTFDTHQVTVLNSNGSPADVDVLMSSYPDSMVFYMGNSTTNDVFGFNHRSTIHGTATIPIISSSYVQLTLYPAGSYSSPILTTSVNANTTDRIVILIGGSGVVLGDNSTDGDNVSDAVEASAPDPDGNGDGIADYQQANVTSLPTFGQAGGDSYVTVAIDGALKLSNVQTQQLSSIPVAPPTGATFPEGLIQFVVPAVTPSADVTVRFYVADADALTGYAKYNPITHIWSQLPSSRVVINTIEDYVEITITDNGVGDDDPTLGRISDPGAPIIGSFDNTPPTITCPSAPTLLVNQPNGSLTATVADAGSGPATPTVSQTISTSVAGDISVTLTAADIAGNSSTVSCLAHVTYRFEGFFEPVSSTSVNAITRVQNVPIKWKLTDYTGAAISDPASVVSVTSGQVSCGSTAMPTSMTSLLTASARPTAQGGGKWLFNWKATGLPTGCRVLAVQILGAAAPQIARFQLR